MLLFHQSQEAHVHDRETRGLFAAGHHALLFAWIAREVIARVGESTAAPVLREATRLHADAGTEFDVLPEGR